MTPSLKQLTARAWVEIDLDALAWNFAQVKQCTTSAVMAVVKAEAYGHGAVMVAKTLVAHGADQLAVATADEGMQLRNAGISVPILIFSSTNAYDIAVLADADLQVTVHDIATLVAYSKAVILSGRKLKIHLKLDTGMNRLGVQLHELPQIIALLQKAPFLEVVGIFSHLAQTGEQEDVYNKKQNDLFKQGIALFQQKAGYLPVWIHLANSAAILQDSCYHYTLVRPGLMLYGLNPYFGCSVPLKPVLSFRSRLIQVKEVLAGEYIGYNQHFKTKTSITIGIVSCGYADGYSRSFTGSAVALVAGIAVPVIGAICMDVCMVDLTNFPEQVSQGTVVTLLGTDRVSQNMVTADQLSAWAGSISYEIVTRIGQRVPRLYYQNQIPYAFWFGNRCEFF